MSETRYALAERCRHGEEIKKSRFLAQAAPVTTSTQALDFLREASDPAASHNCWAYRVGQDHRFNDDGEPGGTAGRPILLAIEGQGIDNVAIVVTRWFGGIKLGAGGLVRAYGGTAAECLRLAPREAFGADGVTLQLHLPETQLPEAQSRITDITRGRSDVVRLD